RTSTQQDTDQSGLVGDKVDGCSWCRFIGVSDVTGNEVRSTRGSVPDIAVRKHFEGGQKTFDQGPGRSVRSREPVSDNSETGQTWRCTTFPSTNMSFELMRCLAISRTTDSPTSSINQKEMTERRHSARSRVGRGVERHTRCSVAQ